MSSLEDYAKSERAFQNAKRLKGNHPKGWEPRIDTSKKEIVSKPQKKAGNPQDHRWDKYLEELGFNPDEFEIIEPFEIRSWDSNTENGKDTFYYYKAKIISKHAVNDKDFDFKSLLSEIKKSKPKPQTINGKSSMIVCLSDWQMGKRDGDGTKGIVERIEQMIPDVTARIKELRKNGVDLAHLYVVGLGDIVEGCEGFYAMQEHSVEYDLRRQKMIARRLLVKSLKAWAPLFKNVVVACVPGNHGENRKNGKAFTTFGDNFDVAIFDEAAEIFQENPAYKHVKFVIPENDLWLTLDVSGTIIGLAHGHQFRTGGRYSHQKAVAWLSGQAFGMTEMGDADILISGHFHHLFVVNEGKRTLMQCPSVDGGSDWFENMTGKSSYAGTLTFSITPGKPQLPWDNLKVL
jgi:predicted phosphodiesterase